MTHRIKVRVPVTKRGFLGIRKTVYETRTIEMDGKTYRKWKQREREQKRAYRNRPYSIEEMMVYDDIFEGD